MKQKIKKKNKSIKNVTNYQILGYQELSIIMMFLARSMGWRCNTYKLKERMFALCISNDNIMDMKFLLAEIYIKRKFRLFIPIKSLFNTKWHLLWSISTYNYFINNDNKKLSVYFKHSKNSAVIEGFIIYDYNKEYNDILKEPLDAILSYKKEYKNEKIKFYSIDLLDNLLDNLDSIPKNSLIMPIFKQIYKN